MSKVNSGHWSVKNELNFAVRAIDITGKMQDAKQVDYDIDPLKYYSDYTFEHNSTTQAAAPEFKDGIYYQVVMARKNDAYPITIIYPEQQDGSKNLDNTVVSEEMLQESDECLSLIKRYLSGGISKLTAGLHTLITNTSEPQQTKDLKKQVDNFVKKNYKNMKLTGSLPDNIEVIESYLRNFPNHWLIDQKNFYLYRAAYADINSDSKSELTDYGTINITSPDAQADCDLQKGNNGGYKIELDTNTKGKATLQYQDGAFSTSINKDKLTLKPFFVSKREVYDGVKLKNKPKAQGTEENQKSSDIIIIFMGVILNDIVIAIPDEIDLTKQNTAAPDNTPVIPSWGYKTFYTALAVSLLTALTILSLWARKRGYFKNSSIRELFNKLDLKRVTPENEPLLEDIGNNEGADRVTIESLENAINDTGKLEMQLALTLKGRGDNDPLPEVVKAFLEKHPEQQARVDNITQLAATSAQESSTAISELDREIRSTIPKQVTGRTDELGIQRTIEFMTEQGKAAPYKAKIFQRAVELNLSTVIKGVTLKEELKTLASVLDDKSKIDALQQDLDKLLASENLQNIYNEDMPLDKAYDEFNQLQESILSITDHFKQEFSSAVTKIMTQQPDNTTIDEAGNRVNNLTDDINNLCDKLGKESNEEREISREE